MYKKNTQLEIPLNRAIKLGKESLIEIANVLAEIKKFKKYDFYPGIINIIKTSRRRIYRKQDTLYKKLGKLTYSVGIEIEEINPEKDDFYYDDNKFVDEFDDWEDFD